VHIKKQISDRKLKANRANALRSTGPKSAAGKATSCLNATRHGILSTSLDLPKAAAARDSSLARLSVPVLSPGPDTHPALQEINQIYCSLAMLLVFEKDSAHSLADLGRNAPLIYRYDRMLTKRLHARIWEVAGVERKDSKESI
jgi:hypothetical protein